MENNITLYLCIFICLLANSLGDFGSFRRRPKLVEIQPKNPMACSTGNLTLTCTRLSNDTSKSLIFQVQGNSVSDEEITIIDNKTISYTMTNLNATQDHNTNVLCCLGPCDFSSMDAKLIQVYDKPKPVENFRCVVHNYLDSMKCDWDLVVNPTPMRVILVWKYPEFSSWNSCPSYDTEDKSDNKTSCTWKSTSDGDFSTKTLYFKVTVTSDCGESASSNYTIDTSNIVKPLPVDNLQTTVLSSRCIKVSWEPGNRAAYVKHYEIYYNRVWDNGTQHVIQINDTEAHKWETKMKKICGLYPYTAYTFTVRAHPEDKGYWSDNTTITAKTYSDIKPLPVDNLQTTVLSSRCIKVSWEPGNRAAYVKHYEIYYNRVWDNGTQHVIQINDTEAHKWETKMKKICGLYPYTDYTFTVRAHPEDKGYWSDNTTITAKTYSDIPSASPRIIKGAFKTNRKECETSAVRQVTVYWLPLKEIDKNGVIEAIKFSDTKLGTQNPRTILLGSKVTHHTVYLDCSSAYSVTVQAKTTNGTSLQMPTIKIPVASYGITCPEFRVEMANTTDVSNSRDVYIECPSVSDERVVGATVFWCEKLSGDCNSAVQWKEFNKNAGVLVLPMTSPENYLYGISMETETGSSGVSKWESCIYTKDVAPSKAPGNLKVGTGTEDKTLSVTWTSLMCASGEPYIHKYILQYCCVDKLNHCVTENKTVEVPAKDTVYVIKDLEEDKRYSIQMRGVTKVGMLGPLSDSVIGTPEINIKPLPVDRLQATVFSSRCIKVSWEPGNRAAYVKHYEIYYTSIWDKGKIHVIQVNDTEVHNETKKEEICALHPYTDYSFTVRAHPEGEGYWSDNTTITAKTYSDIPSASPRIIEGAFKMNSRYCEKRCETSAVRQVTVYWLPLEKIDKNGEIEAIRFSDNKLGTQNPRTILLGSKVTDYTVYLDCTSAYSVTVQAMTINGTSVDKPTIKIPVASYGITCPEFRVEMANTTDVNNSRDVYIECPSVSDDRVLGATVFWCEKQKGKCNSAVQWKEFSKSMEVLEMTMTSPEHYLYGISMETETGSGGLSKWESCIYTKDVAPSRAPSNVKVNPGTEDKTLSVTWTRLLCESDEPYTHKYILQYCRVDNCVTETKTVEVPAMETVYVIEDLEVDKSYSIQMRGVTKVGMLGPLSDTVFGVPEIDDTVFGVSEIDGLTTEYQVAIAVSGLIFGPLIIVGAVFLSRYFYGQTKRKFEPPKIESVLTNLVNEKNTDSYTMTREDSIYTDFRQPMLTRHTSTDSGMGDEPLTPPVSDKKLEINRFDNIPEGYETVTEAGKITAITSEPPETVVYSRNETGNTVHSYNDVDTNMLDTSVEEGIVTRNGISIISQCQFALYNAKADSPIVVADVGLNPVIMASKAVGGYVESTITPVPVTTPVAVTDLELNPVNMANKSVGGYVESTITPVPVTTPVAVTDVGLNPANMANKAVGDHVKSICTPAPMTTPVAVADVGLNPVNMANKAVGDHVKSICTPAPMTTTVAVADVGLNPVNMAYKAVGGYVESTITPVPMKTPVAVTDVGLNPVNMANKAVDDHVESTIDSVPMTTPVAVVDVELNPVNMANKAVGHQVKYTVTPVPMTTPVAVNDVGLNPVNMANKAVGHHVESASTDNAENDEEVNRAFSEETEIQDQDISSSGTLPDYFISMTQEGIPTLGNDERDLR